MFFKNLCILVLWMKVASALETFKFIGSEQIPITVAANKQTYTHQIDRPTKAEQFSLFCNPFIRPASLIPPLLAFGWSLMAQPESPHLHIYSTGLEDWGNMQHSLSQQGIWASFIHPNPKNHPIPSVHPLFCEKFPKMSIISIQLSFFHINFYKDIMPYFNNTCLTHSHSEFL